MARSKESAGGLSPSPPHPVLAKIYSWDKAQNPSLCELISLLEKIRADVENQVDHIVSIKELIFQADDLYTKEKIKSGEFLHLTRWRRMMPLLLDFLDVLDGAANVLDGVADGRVTNAFVQGVRVGLLHEKLLSLVDGRYQEKWRGELARPKGGRNGRKITDKTNVLLESAYAKFGGKKNSLENIAKELHRHGIKGRGDKVISVRTVRRKLQELGHM